MNRRWRRRLVALGAGTSLLGAAFVAAALAAAWRPGSIAIGTTIFQLGIMVAMFGVLSHGAAITSQVFEAGRQFEREEHVCARVVPLRGARSDGELGRRRDLSSA